MGAAKMNDFTVRKLSVMPTLCAETAPVSFFARSFCLGNVLLSNTSNWFVAMGWDRNPGKSLVLQFFGFLSSKTLLVSGNLKMMYLLAPSPLSWTYSFCQFRPLFRLFFCFSPSHSSLNTPRTESPFPGHTSTWGVQWAVWFLPLRLFHFSKVSWVSGFPLFPLVSPSFLFFIFKRSAGVFSYLTHVSGIWRHETESVGISGVGINLSWFHFLFIMVCVFLGCWSFRWEARHCDCSLSNAQWSVFL